MPAPPGRIQQAHQLRGDLACLVQERHVSSAWSLTVPSDGEFIQVDDAEFDDERSSELSIKPVSLRQIDNSLADVSLPDDFLAKEREGSLLDDRWRLDRLVGVGGMAAVYQATHRNGHRAALKILHPNLSRVPEIRQRFLEESYTANRVNHAGVVTIRDECTLSDGTVFLVMDLLEGESLETLHERAHYSPLEALHIIDVVLDVLIAAHAVGIVHRDIKPGNIFITWNGQVKLLDFGIAWRVDALSVDGNFALGTPAFMAPEQAICDWAVIDGRTDLWSLGATLYFLLTGNYVRSAQTPDEDMAAAMVQPVDSVRNVAPTVPAVVTEIVDRALAFDMDSRFPDALSMQLAVRAALHEIERPIASLTPALPALAPTTPRQPNAEVGLSPNLDFANLHSANLDLANLDLDDVDWGKPKLHKYALSLVSALILGCLSAYVANRWVSARPWPSPAVSIAPTPPPAIPAKRSPVPAVAAPSAPPTPAIAPSQLPREPEPKSVSSPSTRSHRSRPRPELLRTGRSYSGTLIITAPANSEPVVTPPPSTSLLAPAPFPPTAPPLHPPTTPAVDLDPLSRRK